MKAREQLDLARAWRAMFLNEDGFPNADAEKVLRDLERTCGWMVSELPVDDHGRTDPYKTAAALEKRGVYAHIKKRIYAPLDALLERAEKET